MFAITRRHCRRWSPLLIVVMVLHWCLGVGTAVADVLCLEPDGRVVLELNGQPCINDAVQTVKKEVSADGCIDLAVDDDHANHEPAAGNASPEPSPIILPVLAMLPPVITPIITGRAAPPRLPNHSVVLRTTTVLLI